jgi:hypothetical protein
MAFRPSDQAADRRQRAGMSACGRGRGGREIGLRSRLFDPASTRKYLDTTSVTRHKMPVMIRINQNALTEVDAMNRSPDFRLRGVLGLAHASAV